MRILLLQSVSLKCSDAGKIILVLKVTTIVTLSVTYIYCKCIGMSDLETGGLLWLSPVTQEQVFFSLLQCQICNVILTSLQQQWAEIFPLFVCPFNWTWPGPIIWPLVSSGHTLAPDPALSHSWHTYGWLPSTIIISSNTKNSLAEAGKNFLSTLNLQKIFGTETKYSI